MEMHVVIGNHHHHLATTCVEHLAGRCRPVVVFLWKMEEDFAIIFFFLLDDGRMSDWEVPTAN